MYSRAMGTASRDTSRRLASSVGLRYVHIMCMSSAGSLSMGKSMDFRADSRAGLRGTLGCDLTLAAGRGCFFAMVLSRGCPETRTYV